MINKFFNSPLQKLFTDENYNNYFIKRDDLIPFSFGGNKCRIAYELLLDMEKLGADCLIGYGGPQSNLVRVLANLCSLKKIKCYIVTPRVTEEEKSFNYQLTRFNLHESSIIKCDRNEVSSTIEYVINRVKNQGYSPYYVNGNQYGVGNENVFTKAYLKAYEEIVKYEQNELIKFDYIFHASGTGMTQSGLILGNQKYSKNHRIIGISIARNQENGMEKIEQILHENNCDRNYKVEFDDNYICGGYGNYNSQIEKTISFLYSKFGVPLDPIYTGKAFWGMQQYLKRNSINNQNILFIHTGGTPIFFDYLRGQMCKY